MDFNKDMSINDDQSSLFGDTVDKQLTNVKLKTQLEAAKKALDVICSESDNESEKKALEFQLAKAGLELEQQRKYLAMAAQVEEDKRVALAMSEARSNIATLMMFHEKGLNNEIPNYEEILAKNVSALSNISILSNSLGVVQPEATVTFHLTENDLKKSMRKTNILEVMRTAKQNGWEIRLSDKNEAFCYKNGKLVDGNTLKKYFVEIESKGEKCKTTQKSLPMKACKKTKPVTRKS